MKPGFTRAPLRRQSYSICSTVVSHLSMDDLVLITPASVVRLGGPPSPEYRPLKQRTLKAMNYNDPLNLLIVRPTWW